MQLGIFAKTFARQSIAANLDAVAQHSFQSTQYNLLCAGLPTLPNEISPALCDEIRIAHVERGLSMAAISATFNIIDPNLRTRGENLRRLALLAEAAPQLGTRVLTLCTGTCDPDDMWRPHPGNSSPAAWSELLSTLKALVKIAESCNVTLAIEPETSNVVYSADRARKLLDEIGSPQLKIVLDGANLIDSPDVSRIREVIDEAIELLGADIVLVHAKDCTWLDGPRHCPAGQGLMDYEFYLSRLWQCGYRGSIVLHGLEEKDVPECARFIRAILANVPSGAGLASQTV